MASKAKVTKAKRAIRDDKLRERRYKKEERKQRREQRAEGAVEIR